jgi:hypothetical protein
MKEHGAWVSEMVKADLSIQTVTATSVHFLMTRQMATVNLPIFKATLTLATGSTIPNTDMESRLGPATILSTQGNSPTAKSMDKENTNGQMAASTMENSLKEFSTAKERTILQNSRKLTPASSKMGQLMASVVKTTKMDVYISGISKMVRKMAPAR